MVTNNDKVEASRDRLQYTAPGLPVITRFFKGKEGRLIQAQGGVAEGGAGRYLDAGFEGGGRGSEPRNSRVS